MLDDIRPPASRDILSIARTGSAMARQR
jgi:hypothetical protein